ncbi:hypothetical protein QML37_30680, partial [Klebsiella pneumoniae]|uniref:hypothetical protein n=1 Tax=Klebsiella pneumoniae TaxID=573 RepID=UPI003A80AD96
GLASFPQDTIASTSRTVHSDGSSSENNLSERVAVREEEEEKKKTIEHIIFGCPSGGLIPLQQVSKGKLPNYPY